MVTALLGKRPEVLPTLLASLASLLLDCQDTGTGCATIAGLLGDPLVLENAAALGEFCGLGRIGIGLTGTEISDFCSEPTEIRGFKFDALGSCLPGEIPFPEEFSVFGDWITGLRRPLLFVVSSGAGTSMSGSQAMVGAGDSGVSDSSSSPSLEDGVGVLGFFLWLGLV